MKDHNFKPHHMNAISSDFKGNNGFGRYILLPGSDGRAEKISRLFSNLEVKKHGRGHNLYKGTIKRNGITIDVGAISSGMGTPSLDIIVHELFHLGARRLLRVGTSGSMQPKRIRVGSLVVPTACVRDEGTSRLYMPLEVPATVSPRFFEAIKNATIALGFRKQTFLGIVHSKDSLYAREFKEGPLADEHRNYMNILKKCGVIASEMECSQLFTLGMTFTQQLLEESENNDNIVDFQTASVLSIIGDDAPFADENLVQQAIKDSIDLSIESLYQLYLLDNKIQGK